eukprot:3938723-Rhodomonas_salina.1
MNGGILHEQGLACRTLVTRVGPRLHGGGDGEGLPGIPGCSWMLNQPLPQLPDRPHSGQEYRFWQRTECIVLHSGGNRARVESSAVVPVVEIKSHARILVGVEETVAFRRQQVAGGCTCDVHAFVGGGVYLQLRQLQRLGDIVLPH